MSIRRDLLMRTALLRMPDVLVAARAAATNVQPLPEPLPALAPPSLPAALPKRRRRTKPRPNLG